MDISENVSYNLDGVRHNERHQEASARSPLAQTFGSDNNSTSIVGYITPIME